MAQNFGQVVKTKRHHLNWTQEELAEQVCCATITIRRIEGNTLRPSLQLAEKLAEVLAVQPDERDAFIELARANLNLTIPAEAAMDSNDNFQAQRRKSILLLVLPLALILFIVAVNPNYLLGLVVLKPPFVITGILPWGWLVVVLIAGLLLAAQRLLWQGLAPSVENEEKEARDWRGSVLLFVTFPTMFIILVAPAILHVFRSVFLN